MKLFIMFTLLLVLLYLAGELLSNRVNRFSVRNLSFMSRDYTTAIKGFSVLTVIWAHAGSNLRVGGIQFIAGVGVALFIICSGYGLEISYKKNGLQDFWKKRVMKVMIPFWVILFMGLFLTGKLEFSDYILNAGLFYTGYSWYIQYIIICYVLFYVAKIVSSKFCCSDLMIIWIAFGAWFIIDSIFFAPIDAPFLRARQMLCFPLGMFIARYKNEFEEFLSSKRLAIVGGMVGILAMAITQLSSVKAWPYIASNVMSLFTVLPLSIAILVLTKIYPVVLKNCLLLKVGFISYEVYLVHIFTLRFARDSIGKLLLYFVLTMTLAFLSNRIFNRLMQ